MNLRLFFRTRRMEHVGGEHGEGSIYRGARFRAAGVRVRWNQEGRYEGESEQLSRNDIRDDGISSVKTSCRQSTCYCLRLPACAYTHSLSCIPLSIHGNVYLFFEALVLIRWGRSCTKIRGNRSWSPSARFFSPSSSSSPPRSSSVAASFPLTLFTRSSSFFLFNV